MAGEKRERVRERNGEEGEWEWGKESGQGRRAGSEGRRERGRK